MSAALDAFARPSFCSGWLARSIGRRVDSTLETKWGSWVVDSHDESSGARVFDGACHLRRGAVAFAGHCQITEGALSFEPSKLDWLAGARSFVITIASIQELRHVDDGDLEIVAASRTVRLTGATVPAIEDTLVQLSGVQVQGISVTQPTEGVLYRGPCRDLHGRLAHEGTVLVTLTELSFQPSRLDRLAGARPWSLALSEVTRFSFGDDDSVELFLGEGSRRLGGPNLRAVSAALRRALGHEPPPQSSSGGRRPSVPPSLVESARFDMQWLRNGVLPPLATPGGEQFPEIVFHEGPCTSIEGAITHEGLVVVTEHFVAFQPSRLDVLSGAQTWTLGVLDLTAIGLNDDGLVLTAGDIVRRLGGLGAAAVEAALRQAFAQLAKTPAEPPALRDGEVVLCSLRASLSRGQEAEHVGMLTITNQRLHLGFEGFERLRSGSKAFVLASDSLRNVRLVDNRIDLDTAIGALHVQSQSHSALFAALCGLADTEAHASDGYRAFDATLLGPGARNSGTLVLSRTAARFASNLGPGRSLALPLAEISRVELGHDRITLRHGRKSHAFEVIGPQARYEELVRLLLELKVEGEPSADDACRYDVQALRGLLAEWSRQLPNLTAGRVVIAGPAVLTREPEYAVRGAIVLFDQGLLFLPASGPSGSEARLAVPIGDIGVLAADEHRGGGFVMSHQEATYHVFPRGGATFVAAFRWIVKKLTKQAALADHESNNRRSAFRVPAPDVWKVHLRLGPSEPGAPERADLAGHILDLSPEGCRVSLDAELPQHAALTLYVPTASGTLRLEAEVVYSLKPTLFVPHWRYGICFVRLTPELAQALNDLWMLVQRISLVMRGDDALGLPRRTSLPATSRDSQPTLRLSPVQPRTAAPTATSTTTASTPSARPKTSAAPRPPPSSKEPLEATPRTDEPKS